MYCVHCGADGAATFCAACGRRQRDELDASQETGERPETIPDPHQDVVLATLVARVDWTESIQYQTVLGSSEVRERISSAGKQSKASITGDDLLAIFDAVSPLGVSLEKLTNAILPIYDRFGIKINRDSQGVFDAPRGRVMLAVLCTLAAKSFTIDKVLQDHDQCSFHALIPTGLMTNKGRLEIRISPESQCVRVSIGITISGQWYDFGKSSRMLDEIFASIFENLTAQLSGNSPRYLRVA